MRPVRPLVLALLFTLFFTTAAYAPPGRFVPLPRAPGGIGGGGARFIPIHTGSGGSGLDGDFCFGFVIVALVIGGIVLIVALIRGARQSRKSDHQSLWHHDENAKNNPFSAPPNEQAGDALPFHNTLIDLMPLPAGDHIHSPDEVAAKAQQTQRLLEELTWRDEAFDPRVLLAWIRSTFEQLCEGWQRRDYGVVAERLGYRLFKEHSGLMQKMRACHEIERMDDLVLERVEFVHVHFTGEPEEREVAALLTYRVRFYYVEEVSGNLTRGNRDLTRFQDCWGLRRAGESWRLDRVDHTPQTGLLERENQVEG